MLSTLFNIVSVIAAFVAAYFWYRSATEKIIVKTGPYKSDNKELEKALEGKAIPVDAEGKPLSGQFWHENGVYEDSRQTQKLQSHLSRRGALAAAISATFLGFDLLTKLIPNILAILQGFCK